MKKKKDLCDICGGELNRQKINYELTIKQEMLLITNIFADKCTQCGEIYLDAEASEMVDNIYTARNQLKPTKYIPVPVFKAEKQTTHFMNIIKI